MIAIVLLTIAAWSALLGFMWYQINIAEETGE